MIFVSSAHLCWSIAIWPWTTYRSVPQLRDAYELRRFALRCFGLAFAQAADFALQHFLQVARCR